jgi:hypothetical protein
MESATRDRITVQISVSFWTAYLATLQVIVRSPLLVAISAVFPLWGIYMFYTATVHHDTPVLGTYVILVLCLLFTPISMALSLFMARTRNPLSKGPFTYAFDASGIHISSAASRISLNWTTIRKVRESNDFIFFFSTASRAQSVPLAQIRAAGVLDDLRILVREHVANVKPASGR